MTREWPADMCMSNPYRNKKAYLSWWANEKTDGDELTKIAIDKNIPIYEMYIDYAPKEYVMNYRKKQ